MSAVWVRPAAGGARFTSDYGPRRSPGGVGSTWHRGIDLAPPKPQQVGFPVLAAADGEVVASGYSSVRGYWLVQRAGDGSHLRYQHIAGPTIGKGTRVRAGQILGAMGETGAATGEHLHFETYAPGTSWAVSSAAVDPEPFMRARGVDLRTGVVTVSRPVGGVASIPTAPRPTPIAPVPEEDIMVSRAENQQDMQAAVTPVTRALADVAAAIDHLKRRDFAYRLDGGGHGIFIEVGTDSRLWLDAASYSSVGRPGVVPLPPDHPFWARVVLYSPGELYRREGDPSGAAYVLAGRADDGGAALRHVQRPEYEAMLSPLITPLPDAHPIWARPVIG